MSYIAVDFDGTCVTHEFPKVGQDIGAAEVLKDLVANGHKLILWTMRSETESNNCLTPAIDWFVKNDIPLFGVNVNPTQHTWTSSRKAYAHLYIDDAALGIPIIHDVTICHKPFVNWIKVSKILEVMGYLPSTNPIDQ